MLKILLGRMLGIAIMLYSNHLSLKWKWLAHFLLASGTPMKLPESLARDWNKNLVRAIGNSKYLIRPYPSELFWIVGSMIVEKTSDKVYGEDVYSFQPQTGQNVIHGADKSLQYAWSGGDGDPTQITGKLATYLLVIARMIGLTESIVKIDNQGRLLVSNEIWNVLGGKEFKTILEYKYR